MEIKDKEVLELLEMYPSREVEYRVDSYSPAEVFEDSDLKLVLNVAQDVYELLHTKTTRLGSAYAKGMGISARTNGFMTTPISPTTFKPVFTNAEWKDAKEILEEEYNVRSLVSRLSYLERARKLPFRP